MGMRLYYEDEIGFNSFYSICEREGLPRPKVNEEEYLAVIDYPMYQKYKSYVEYQFGGRRDFHSIKLSYAAWVVKRVVLIFEDQIFKDLYKYAEEHNTDIRMLSEEKEQEIKEATTIIFG